MDVIVILLLLLGTAAFAAAAVCAFSRPPRGNILGWISAGLLCWILSVLIPALDAAL